MGKKYENQLLETLMSNNDYIPIELEGRGEFPNAWCAQKNGYNQKMCMIFLNKENINYINKYKEIILSNSNNSSFGTEIIYAIITNENENYWRNLLVQTGDSFESLIVIDSNYDSILLDRLPNDEISRNIEDALKRIQLSKRKVHKRNDGAKISLLIITINLVVYTISIGSTISKGGSFFSNDLNVLYDMGSNINIQILLNNKQFYRLFTSMFLHSGITHLGFNMYALYILGPVIEKVYGEKSFVLIYLVSGLTSSVLSSFFLGGRTIGIGASGAIYGLLGAALIFGFKKRKSIGKAFFKNILVVLIINVVMSVTVANIDMYGHLGGLLGGMAIAAGRIKNG